MKQQLEELNQYLLDFQLKANPDDSNIWSYSHADKISFSEYDGLFDITWFSSYYGTESYSIKEMPRYKSQTPLNTMQHCVCEPLNVSDCECEYEGEGFSWLIDLLIQYPKKIRSLSFTGTDTGSNGLRQWDFERLIENDVIFPNLTELKVQLNEVGNHNAIFIGNDTENHNQVSNLLVKMPNLLSVELPTTPDESFFKSEFLQLSRIKIQSGDDSHDFIRHLSKSKLLSQITLDFSDVNYDGDLSYVSPENKRILEATEEKLSKLDAAGDSEEALKIMKEQERQEMREAGLSEEELILFFDNPNREEALRLLKITCDSEQEVKDSMVYMDSNETWDENGEAIIYDDEDLIDDYQTSESFQKRTSVEDYTALFQSKYISDGFHFKLRESYLTKDELFTLQNTNKKVQFLHIPTHEDYYVSHRMQDEKLW